MPLEHVVCATLLARLRSGRVGQWCLDLQSTICKRDSERLSHYPLAFSSFWKHYLQFALALSLQPQPQFLPHGLNSTGLPSSEQLQFSTPQVKCMLRGLVWFVSLVPFKKLEFSPRTLTMCVLVLFAVGSHVTCEREELCVEANAVA